MTNKIYVATATEEDGQGRKDTYILGVYSTLEGAQHKLQFAIQDDQTCNSDCGPFTLKDTAEDICFTDSYGKEYHYNILERFLDEI